MKSPAFIRLTVIFFLCSFYQGMQAQSISGVINSYYRVTVVNTAINGLTLSSAGGLLPGTRVLIIQMKGAVIDNTNTASFGDITNISLAGTYEYNTICSVAGNDVLLKSGLTHSYNPSGNVQLITVPQYNIVTVADTVKANTWDVATGTGGVVVLEADTLYLNSAISASGKGFSGGAFVNFTTPTYDCVWATNVTNYFLQLTPVPDQYYSGGPKGEGIAAYITNAEYGRGKQANGGGGGNNHNTGGAGGANYGTGGNGGRRTNESFFLCHGANPGIAGISISSFGYTVPNNRIFLGGGGGSSHQNNSKGMPGGNGGGIVLITANVMIGTGTSVLADGLSPVNLTNVDPYTADGDGGGGGGAGGSIILNVNEVIGNIDASVKGARGSDASRAVSDCTGPGGGGGGGVVWMNGASFSPNIIPIVTGGANGVVSALSTIPACVGQPNGATAGTAGSSLTGYVPPAMGSYLCAPLSVRELKSFKGRSDQKNVSLWWTMITISNIRAYEVERSIDQVNYSTIAHISNNGNYAFTLQDKDSFTGTIFYRIKLIRTNGTVGYSNMIEVTEKSNTSFSQMNIFPNPVAHQLKVVTLVAKNMETSLRIFNASGQCVFQKQYKLSKGSTTIIIPVDHLSVGIHWLMVEGEGIHLRKRFIKSD